MQTVHEQRHLRNVHSKAGEGNKSFMLAGHCVLTKVNVERQRMIEIELCAHAKAD